jgi:hypothetical protein
MKISKYNILNDKNWLHQQYIENQLTIASIARLCGIKCNINVKRALIRSGIELRKTPGHKVENDDGFVVNDSVLTGCLLGDAWLRIANKNTLAKAINTKII